MPAMTKDQLKAMIDEIVKDITGSTIDERIKEHTAKQGSAVDQLLNGLGRRTVDAPAEKGQLVTRAMLAVAGARQAMSGGRVVSPEAYAEKVWGKDAAVTKALAAGTLADGGALIGEQMSSDFIELLRPASVFRQLNPVVAPMSEGNLTMPKLTGGAIAGYIGENQPAGKTQQTTGNVKATAKKIAALVPVSNDLIRRPSISTETMVRNDASPPLPRPLTWR
jgi:HK97 family phage major capsid protein